MKKIITILMILALCLVFAFVASAEEMEKSGQPLAASSQEKEVSSQPSAASGQEIESVESGNDEFKAYIEEKIMPVIIGVATSIVALLSTLKGVFNALRGLKESKDTFDKEQAKIKENSKKELEQIKRKYDEIKVAVECVPLISEEIKALCNKTSILSQEIAGLSKIASLGFSKESELVREGKSREIVRIANKNEELIVNEGL